MNRITTLFEKKHQQVLNMYCTAGFPMLDDTEKVLMSLQLYGADMVELGIPYSDPLADGAVIQDSSSTALANGMTVATLFTQLKNIRPNFNLPLVLMGYLNPVLQYGFEKFCADAAAVEVDGIILPDLPMHEFESIYQPIFKKHQLHFIFLVTPETSEERVRKIDQLSTGFLYAVSSSSTTGNEKAIEEQEDYFKKLQAMQLKNPVLVGFGIKDRSSFLAASKYSNGSIIGSAYIKALHKPGTVESNTKEFLNSILT